MKSKRQIIGLDTDATHEATETTPARLADWAVCLFRASARTNPILKHTSGEARRFYLAGLEKTARMMAEAILRGDYVMAGFCFVECHYEGAWLQFLETAIPHMSPEDAADALRAFETSSHGLPRQRALRLFQRVSALRESVPSALPDNVRVYRGFVPGYGGGSTGVAWSLRRNVAAWFATMSPAARYFGGGRVASGTIARSDLMAYFSEREEATLILDARRVRGKKYEVPTDADLAAADRLVRLRQRRSSVDAASNMSSQNEQRGATCQIGA